MPRVAQIRTAADLSSVTVFFSCNLLASEIAEPAGSTALLQACKPAAQGIKREHHKSPDHINHRQGVSPAGGRSDGKLTEAWRFEHPVGVSIARIAHGDG